MRHSYLNAISRCSGQQLLDFRLARRRCLFGIISKGLPDLEKHLLQTGWGDGDQQLRLLVALVLEGMQTADGHIQERSGLSNNSVFAQLKRHLTFEDQERLFLPAVDMWRRTATGRDDGFEGGIFPIGIFTNGKKAVDVADDSNPASFARLSHRCWVFHAHHVNPYCPRLANESA